MTATPNDTAALQPIDPTAATANNHVGLIRSIEPIGDPTSYSKIPSCSAGFDDSSDTSGKLPSPDEPPKSAVA